MSAWRNRFEVIVSTTSLNTISVTCPRVLPVRRRLGGWRLHVTQHSGSGRPQPQKISMGQGRSAATRPMSPARIDPVGGLDGALDALQEHRSASLPGGDRPVEPVRVVLDLIERGRAARPQRLVDDVLVQRAALEALEARHEVHLGGGSIAVDLLQHAAGVGVSAR
jgi:hypothetical protein